MNRSLLVAALCLPASIALSQEATVTIDVTFASKYVFRGVQLADDVWHPSVEVVENGAYLGLWGAIPFENRGWPEYYDEEYDVYLGKEWALNKDTYFDLGATWYTFQDADDSIEAYVGFVKELGTFTPSFYLYRDFDLETFAFEFATGFSLPMEKWPFELTARLGRSEEDHGDGYTYWEADVIYPWQISDAFGVKFGLHYSDHDLDSLGEGDHLFGSFSASYQF